MATATAVKKKKLSKKSKFKIAMLVILAAVLLIPILWWGVVYFFGPEKYLSKTFNMDWLVAANGETQPMFEVMYHRNKDYDGLEMFELKLNYFQDEEKNNIYSQGLQYVANDEYTPIDFSFYIDDSKPVTRNKAKDYSKGVLNVSVYDAWGGYKMNSENSTYYNYMSDNDYSTTTASTNPINMYSKLKVELSNSESRDTYWLGLKGTGINTNGIEPENKILTNSVPPFIVEQTYYYSYVDYNYLAKYLYESVKPLKSGTSEVIINEFGDIFDFYKFEDGEYKKVTLDPGKDADGKIIEEVKSYCSIKITITDAGAKTYEDSLFKAIKNDGNFNLTPDRITDDYFIGRSIINCTNKDFDYVKLTDDTVAFKLKQSFINEYLKYKNRIELSILINLDDLEKEGYNFFGFADDSGLKNFHVKEAYTIKGQDKSEVKV